MRGTIAVMLVVACSWISAFAPAARAEDEGPDSLSARLTIKVIGRDGNTKSAMKGAEVSAPGLGARTQTNSSGVATMTGLEAGTLKLLVSRDGWTRQEQTIVIDEEQESVTIELTRLLTKLTVKVRGVSDDGTKKVVEGCKVRIALGSGGSFEKPTDSSGVVVFDQLPRGVAMVKVIPQQSWRTKVESNYRLKDEKQTLELALERKLPPQPQDESSD